jgi:hypothetical protein
MKNICLLMLFIALTGAAWAGDDSAHFTKVEVPPAEMRLDNLSRLIEYRCNYEFAAKARGALLIAEYHSGATVTDYLLPLFIFLDPQKGGAKQTGTLSIAWHLDFHNLILAGERMEDSGAIHLPDFNPEGGFFFQASSPETRKPTGKNAEHGMEFQLYPVMGISGDRQLQLGFDKSGGVREFLDACERAQAKGAVVIYLYFSTSDEEPCMDFKKSPPPGIPEGKE